MCDASIENKDIQTLEMAQCRRRHGLIVLRSGDIHLQRNGPRPDFLSNPISRLAIEICDHNIDGTAYLDPQFAE